MSTPEISLDPFIKFNKTLKYFIRCMIEAFPEHSEYKLLHTVYKLLKTLSKKQPYKIFMTMTCNCHDRIIAKDEPYFFANTLDVPESRLQKIYYKSAERWQTFDQETKDKIWEHLISLVNRAQECSL